MLWDLLVILFIVAFAYGFSFKEDVPPKVLTRSLLLMLLILVMLNISSIVQYLTVALAR